MKTLIGLTLVTVGITNILTGGFLTGFICLWLGIKILKKKCK